MCVCMVSADGALLYGLATYTGSLPADIINMYICMNMYVYVCIVYFITIFLHISLSLLVSEKVTI